MAPAVTRELSIEYGGFTVGGATDYLIDGYVNISKSFTLGSVEFTVLVQDDTESGFATKISDIEAAFRDPFNTLKIEQGAETLLEFAHGAATGGFNTKPEILKREDLGNTGRSRRYTIRVDADLPADNVSVSGHRESTVNVAYSPSRRRTVTVSGVWTAFGGASAARGAYEAAISGFASGVLSSLGGVFELAEEPTTEHDTENKLLRFSQVYDEIIFGQAGAGDNAAIVRQVFRLAREESAPGDSGALDKPQTAVVNYECWIDKDVSLDLVSQWEGTIRDFVIQQAEDILGAAGLAVLSERPEFEFDNNRIFATMEVLGVFGNVLSFTQTIELFTKTPSVLVPVWTGDPLARYLYQGIETTQRTTTTQVRQRGGGTTGGSGGGGGSTSGGIRGGSFTAGAGGSTFGFFQNSGGRGRGGSFGGTSFAGTGFEGGFRFRQPGTAGGGGGGGGGQAAVEQGVFIPISQKRSRTPLKIGIAPNQVDVEDIETELVEEKANVISGTFGGGTQAL